MSDQPEDLEKTSKMDEPPAKKKAKEKGDWITMPMPAAKKGAEAPTSASESTEEKPSPPKPPAASSAPPSAPAAAQAPAPASTPAATGAPASGGGVGSFLSNFGINDPNTQKVVLFGGGGFLLLCCLCTCIGVGVSMMGGLSSFQ